MPNQQPVFTGVAVALVTFFDEHGQVDAAATAKHALHLAERGVRAVVVAGSTGEASHLSMKERLQLFDAVRAVLPAELPVLLGTGDLAPGVSVPDLTRRAAQHGAAAALVLSPYKGDVREFYGEVVSAAGSMPVLAYHWPKVSPPGISLEDLKALKVAGLKDSTGDTERMLEVLAFYKNPFYAGNSSVVAYAGMLGCTGCILAAANLEPERCIDAFAGDIPAQKALLPAHRIVSTYGVKGIKEELARRHGTSTVCR
ncbi:MAG: dihydrodipicolinate synthase family protein [Acidimicrobiia bacterium]